MSDIERRLRELGERARSDQPPASLPPQVTRRVKRRRLATLTTSVLVTAALAFGGAVAVGAFGRPLRIGPAESPDQNFSRLVSLFSEDERVMVEVDAEEGTICALLGSLAGNESLTRVEVVADLDDPDTVVALRPSDQTFVPKGGGAECVRNVDHDLASDIIARPGRYFLLVEGPNEPVRISALSEAHGDGNYAIGPRITIAGGNFLGVEWEYYGYESNDGLCLEFAWGRANSGGGCGFEEKQGPLNVYGTSSWQEPGGAAAFMIEGQVSDAVSRLELEIADEPPDITDNRPDEVEIYQPPPELRLRNRVFAHLIDARRLDRDAEVWLVAYDAKNQQLDRQRVNVRGMFGKEILEPSKEDTRREFPAFWPEDTYQAAERACAVAAKEEASDNVEGDDVVSYRSDPESVVLEFGYEVLGWEQAVVVERTGGREFGPDRTVFELRRGNDQGLSPRPPRVIVDATEAFSNCWSVSNVSRMPDREPTGFSVSVRGRDVQIGVDTLEATSLSIEVGYAGRKVSESGPVGRNGLGEFQLDFDPDTPGYALVLFLDENGEVFSAASAHFSAGDFAAG